MLNLDFFLSFLDLVNADNRMIVKKNNINCFVIIYDHMVARNEKNMIIYLTKRGAYFQSIFQTQLKIENLVIIVS